MARPKSEEKQLHLLLAAAEAVAERGVGAPTALIAKRAGVAEGTLFRYFPNKEALLNEVYLFLSRQLSEQTAAPVDRTRSLEERARVTWNNYIDWGLEHPVWIRAMNQLAVTDILTEATRDEDKLLFPDPELLEFFLSVEAFAGLPQAFGDAIFYAIADATLAFATREPDRAEEYKRSGFEASWRIIKR